METAALSKLRRAYAHSTAIPEVVDLIRHTARLPWFHPARNDRKNAPTDCGPTRKE